jgi:hypothetical protein
MKTMLIDLVRNITTAALAIKIGMNLMLVALSADDASDA